jgi:methionyl-tRNA synthetase
MSVYLLTKQNKYCILRKVIKEAIMEWSLDELARHCDEDREEQVIKCPICGAPKAIGEECEECGGDVKYLAQEV